MDRTCRASRRRAAEIAAREVDQADHVDQVDRSLYHVELDRAAALARADQAEHRMRGSNPRRGWPFRGPSRFGRPWPGCPGECPPTPPSRWPSAGWPRRPRKPARCGGDRCRWPGCPSSE